MFDTAHFHPMIVHFPVALITIGFVTDFISLFYKREKCLSKTGFYLMILGALGAIVAWSSGHLFTNEPSQGQILEVFEKHETGALVTVILIVLGSALRIWMVVRKKEDTKMKWIVFGFYFLSFAAVTYTGFMGGTMVYNFMLSI